MAHFRHLYPSVFGCGEDHDHDVFKQYLRDLETARVAHLLSLSELAAGSFLSQPRSTVSLFLCTFCWSFDEFLPVRVGQIRKMR